MIRNLIPMREAWRKRSLRYFRVADHVCGNPDCSSVIVELITCGDSVSEVVEGGAYACRECGCPLSEFLQAGRVII
jgi:hypothetical protein